MVKYTINFIFILCILFTSAFSIGQTASYELKMSKPQNHYFEVKMTLEDIKDKEVTVKLPVWSPGSYLVREFSKNLNQVKATNEKGKELVVTKTSKNAWKIERGDAKQIHVHYEVYAFELSVRTSFLDLTHGFVSGSGVFMYTEQTKNNKGSLKIIPHANFKTITTALPAKGEDVISETKSYEFVNYDQLVDCPIEIGNQEVFNFKAAGVNHTVGIYGQGNYDIPTLKKDMAKIVEAATNVFGQNPNKEYTFIIHNVVDGQGGLEHMNSTTLSVNRWTYTGSDYIGFLSLVAHEYFHLWNVKRIRPVELGPFNYDAENYTSLLWVMEGFTSYYDELLMLRAGYYDKNQYIGKFIGSINYVEGSVGTRVQPVAHASFDAWIKAYRPDENSANTTMTYYSRGANIAAILDAMIIKEYDGKKCLDHFMQLLYANYYEKLGRGFSEAELEKELSAFLHTDMKPFFAKYINGTEIPDFNSVFEKVGLGVEYVGVSRPSFGANYSQSGGSLTVTRIRSNSTAENGGLSVKDEIIGCNGYRVNQSDLEKVINELSVGQSIKLLVSRDNVLLELTFKMETYERPQFDVVPKNEGTRGKLMEYWLRSDN